MFESIYTEGQLVLLPPWRVLRLLLGELALEVWVSWAMLLNGGVAASMERETSRCEEAGIARKVFGYIDIESSCAEWMYLCLPFLQLIYVRYLCIGVCSIHRSRYRKPRKALGLAYKATFAPHLDMPAFHQAGPRGCSTSTHVHHRPLVQLNLD